MEEVSGPVVIRQYGGVCQKNNSASDRENAASTEKKVLAGLREMSMELPVPGILESPFGVFESKIFSYKKQKIEEKKYTKWLDYDKIEKNPYIRTRRTGDYMVINAQGNTKKLNRCMIDEKIPSEYRDSIPLIACGKEILWMVGSRMNERYKINPQTRKVLVLNYQGGNENE